MTLEAAHRFGHLPEPPLLDFVIGEPPTILYFTTSLPTMLRFEDDHESPQVTTALFLQSQARLGLGQNAKAKTLLKTVLRRSPDHAPAADLLASVE